MDVESTDEMLSVFKALAHAARLRILGLLAVRDLSVDEITDAVGLKPPTVSHHLATLRKAGLVSMRGVGTTHLYSFSAERLQALNRALAPERIALPADVSNEAWDRKVLRDFLGADGRLRSIPMGERKRLVVLRWVASRFEPERDYTELEVNLLVSEVHNDHAALRRYLVDHGFMTRRAGIYRRLPDTNTPIPDLGPAGS